MSCGRHSTGSGTPRIPSEIQNLVATAQRPGRAIPGRNDGNRTTQRKCIRCGDHRLCYQLGHRNAHGPPDQCGLEVRGSAQIAGDRRVRRRFPIVGRMQRPGSTDGVCKNAKGFLRTVRWRRHQESRARWTPESRMRLTVRPARRWKCCSGRPMPAAIGMSVRHAAPRGCQD